MVGTGVEARTSMNGMLISARLLAPTDLGWLIDHVSVDGETVTLVARYSMNPRRNQRLDTVAEAARAEALWRRCRVHVSGGRRRRRLPIARRCDLVVQIEPPPFPTAGHPAIVR